MTNPVKISLPIAEWYKVASGVNSGNIRILDHSSEYLYSQRDAGDGPPTDRDEGALFEGLSMTLASAVPMDVYIYAFKGGKVRVDL